MNKLLAVAACAALLSSCAPTMTALKSLDSTSAPAPSAPLLAGQTWEVEGGSVAVRAGQTFKITEIFEAMPGTYSNLDAAGLTAARRGKPEQGMTLFPAASYSRLGQRLEFFWSENGTDYQCRIENAAPGATQLTGRFLLSGTDFGSCTARLR